MPEIAAFCGLRYNADRFGQDWSNLVAPPYDVLDADDKAELLRRDDRNIVAVDLPHVPPKSAGPDEVYDQAADLLRQWRDEAGMNLDGQPAIYVYHQQYEHAGQAFTRRMFLSRMRLEPFGSGKVFPHEQTFGGPKEDRLKLMHATRCQLSPVFSLYSDPDNAVSGLLDPGDQPPDVTAELQGVVNRLWVVQDIERIGALCKQLADRAVYIADGHHRYGTALRYLDELTAAGELPMDHPARFILVGLCAMEDPGCLILPTHRVISGLGDTSPSQILNALQPGLKTVAANPDLTDPAHVLPADSADDLAVYLAAGDRFYTGRFTQREILQTLAADQSQAWRELDLAYLHRYLIDELITKEALGGRAPAVQCVKALDQTIAIARETNGIAFICKPCTMADLRAVSEAGDLMPQKSTYFYPKLVTGLVVNPLG